MNLNKCPKSFADKTKKEVAWWIRLGWTTPFVGLGALFFLYFIGWTELYEKILVITATSFFAIAVYWWWWALYKILNIAELLDATIKKFDAVKKEIKEVRKDLGD